MEETTVKIHEYQAKELMKSYGIPVLNGTMVETVEDGINVANSMFASGNKRLFIKAQVHAGGRGKAGGIASVRTPEETRAALHRILGMRLVTPQTGVEGKLVRKVMIVDGDQEIAQEMYAGIVLDREHESPVLLASAKGGVDIEELAANHPESIAKISIDPCTGLLAFQIRNLCRHLDLNDAVARICERVFLGMYRMFIDLDCSQIEINPLAIMSDAKVVALDAKVSLDESAFFRHPQLAELRDPLEESPLEVWAARNRLNYVKLDGSIGCMVNGAGLAMATMDTIHRYGGEPANFLDIGGGANSDTITEAFRILLSDPSVQAILINIFGGIVRCDRVAEGLIRAAKDSDVRHPLVIRLAGTNAPQGMELLRKSGLPIETAESLDDAAERVVALSREGDRQ